MYFCLDGYNRWYVCLCNFREWYVIRFQTESTQVGKVGWGSHSFPGNLPPRKRLSRQLHSAICLHLSCPAQGNNQDFKLSRLPPGCHLILGPGVQTRKASEVIPMHCNDSLPAGRVLLSARRRSCLSLHFCCCVFFSRNNLKKWGQRCCTLLKRRA